MNPIKQTFTANKLKGNNTTIHVKQREWQTYIYRYICVCVYVYVPWRGVRSWGLGERDGEKISKEVVSQYIGEQTPKD